MQKKAESWYLQFMYQNKQYPFARGAVSQTEADAKIAEVDYLLMRLKQRLITLPVGSDIVVFIKNDENPQPTISLPENNRQALTLGILRDRCLETHQNGTGEENRLNTRKSHVRHLESHFNEGLPIAELTQPHLQEYVNARSKKVIATTSRRELATFRADWNYGEVSRLLSGRLPSKGLRFPKLAEKPFFVTRAEAVRMIEGGADSDLVWDAHYLTTEEISELLDYVKENASQPFVYPLFCFACHTGARRSSLRLAFLIPSIEGQNGSKTLMQCCNVCLSNGMTVQETFEFLIGEWNDLQAVPTWPEADIRHAIESALKKLGK